MGRGQALIRPTGVTVFRSVSRFLVAPTAAAAIAATVAACGSSPAAVRTASAPASKPSDAFYASLGTSKAALSLLEGKYIKVKSDDSLVGNISQLCTLNDLLGTVGQAPRGGYTDTLSTVQGQPAIRIAQPGHSGYAYVCDSAKPVLLEVTAPGASGGSITFSDYDAPVRIAVPPAAQTIDGSELGL